MTISVICATASEAYRIQAVQVIIMELQILQQGGKKTGLLAECSEEDLAWLASVLRSRLGLPPAA